MIDASDKAEELFYEIQKDPIIHALWDEYAIRTYSVSDVIEHDYYLRNRN